MDEDLGINSQLTYFIQSGNHDDLFSITPDGTFQILHSLDKERESLYIVTITAVDSGNSSQTSRHGVYYSHIGLTTSTNIIDLIVNAILFFERFSISNWNSDPTYHCG